MKISYNWLKEFVDIPVSAKHLAEDLSLFGHEVEDVIKYENDWILDLSITANRGDCLSILGIAREISAFYNNKIKLSQIKIEEEKIDKKINIKIAESKICPRFTARIIDNIKIAESPKWIKEKLASYGFRSINNIVDITNLIMVELGQPLHAFDYHKIDCGNVLVRKAKKNESLITLDGIERKLDENSIIIEDKKKIYDLAGIMGGINSEIDKKTKTILLQGSVFDPILIRRTSKRLNLTTDASYRFERKVDIDGTILAVDRAANLIKECCENTKIGSLIDIGISKCKKKLIKIKTIRINNLIGKKFKQKEIENNLRRLNIFCKNNVCEIPSYRLHNLVIWQALAGEVARIYRFNKLPIKNIKPTKTHENTDYNKKEYIKDILVKNGFTEIYSYSFSNEKLLNLLSTNLQDCRFAINSVTPENKYFRSNLESSILTAVSKNPWAPEINIFEIGKVFSKSFGEKWQIGIAATQKNTQNIKNILALLNIRTDIKSFDKRILDYLKIRKIVKYVIIDLNKINVEPDKYQEEFKITQYKPISEFPPTIRDVAIVVNSTTNSSEILTEIYKANNEIFIVELFDEFTSEKIGRNKKSLTYHIWMQNLNRPMRDLEANKIIEKIIKNLNNKFGAKLRS